MDLINEKKEELKEMHDKISDENEVGIKNKVTSLLEDKLLAHWGRENISKIKGIVDAQMKQYSKKIFDDAEKAVDNKPKLDDAEKKVEEIEEGNSDLDLEEVVKEFEKKLWKFFERVDVKARKIADMKYKVNTEFKMNDAKKYEEEIRAGVEDGRISPEEAEQKYYEFAGNIIEYRERDNEQPEHEEQPEERDEDPKPEEKDPKAEPKEEENKNAFLDGLRKDAPSQQEQKDTADKFNKEHRDENARKEPSKDDERSKA